MSLPKERSDFRSRLGSPALQAVFDHWQDVRADNLMPRWEDISPTVLSSHLRRLWVFHFDHITGGFTARLANNNAMVVFGKSFRGTPLKDLHPPHVLEIAYAEMTKVVSEPAAFRSGGNLFRIGSRTIEGERIMLPLASDGRHADGILGCSDFQYPSISGPVELIFDQVERASVSSLGHPEDA